MNAGTMYNIGRIIAGVGITMVGIGIGTVFLTLGIKALAGRFVEGPPIWLERFVGVAAIGTVIFVIGLAMMVFMR